jgi:3-hydroxyacyl-CoA dehydrogenase/enoyl-CoA hydratase/3-hydroxybutyryl-CoA epimerase
VDRQHVTWRVEDSIAIVTIDCPDAKVNTLDETLLDALESVARELTDDAEITAVVVMSGKGKGFIAGADIKIIENVTDQVTAEKMARRGQRVFQQWADMSFPVVAAINGHCLGGGLELALACDARLGTPDAQLGLPEVKLGILPGFGGTQRLPRLIGLEKSLDLILSGRILDADHAYRIGLLDKVTATDDLFGQALAFARDHARKKGRMRPRGWRAWLLEGNPLGRAMLFNKARKMLAKRTGGHYPAPVSALEVLSRTSTMSIAAGLAIEAKVLGELAVSPVCKNLIYVYQLSQKSKHTPTLSQHPLDVTHAAVLGAGTMGSGIAWLLARKGFHVTLKDLTEDLVSNGLQRIKRMADRHDSSSNAEAFERIQGTTEDRSLDACGLVIEAVLEKMPVKQQVLREVEKHIATEAVFASNTSSLSISEMQSTADRPHNVVGLHFFNPVDRMPLVEIIRGELTGDQAIATAFSIAQRLGKTPVLVADSPGFLVNRLLVVYLNEACLLVEEGVDWHSIEQLALDFGMPMGPFRLIDEVGIDIACEVGKIICGAFPYLRESGLLEEVARSGFLGRKNRKGFYQYRKSGEQRVNPAIDDHLPKRHRQSGPEDWQRLIMLMVAEATRCLDEKIVASAADIDTAMIFGTGFPPFRGGLCRWADQMPHRERVAAVEELGKKFGERFRFSDTYRESLQFYND